MASLFDPVHVGDLCLPNRLVMAPMPRVRSDDLGLANASTAAHYAQCANAGLIITEGIQTSRIGQSNPRTPGLHTVEQVESWRPVTSVVHRRGGRIFAQIMHAGRVSHSETTGHQPVAPSAIAARGVSMFTPSGLQPAPVPRALSTAEVAGEAACYAAAALNAIDAGFDGVELHGANGYLIAQFLSSNANLRTDRYGGSIDGRIRFAVEAVSMTVDAVGAGRVGLRLSPGAGIADAAETDVPEMYGALLAELASLGLAYVHLTASVNQDLFAGLRRAWPGTLIVNPSMPTDPALSSRLDAECWMAKGADLISLGRAFHANPDLVERLRSDLPLATADPATVYQSGEEGYLIYRSYPSERPEPADADARGRKEFSDG
ncbi:alkene reductase [Actinoplanes solisilvae]|uniref:alkene reductase n=1 Tax=Actinoplanes solisilvae TaxID=2486853 RepID=UPI000FDAFE7C|nr:alkene reductase [Actinoplanes solisilvae]